MRIILYCLDDPVTAAEAASKALNYAHDQGVPLSRWMGLRVAGKYYTADFNKRSITVREVVEPRLDAVKNPETAP